MNRTKTTEAYDTFAPTFAVSHHNRIPETARRFAQGLFTPGKRTLDLGCGSGRDTVWLHQQGYSVAGSDASVGMIREARERYSEIDIEFFIDSLPALTNTQDEVYENIFCNAVLMHIPDEDLFATAQNIAKKLTQDGVIVVTYKNQDPHIDPYGRELYSRSLGHLISLFSVSGLRLIKHAIEPDDQVPNSSIRWYILAFTKTGTTSSEGIQKVASILENDSKTTSYKYALLRALCIISRDSDVSVQWKTDDSVSIKMSRITREWIKLYWPFVSNSFFIAQGKDDFPDSKLITVRTQLAAIPNLSDSNGFQRFFDSFDEEADSQLIQRRKIRDSIIEGPIKHSGGAGEKSKHGNKIFLYDKETDSLVIPGYIWQDIENYAHWIEDSVVMRWAKYTLEINQTPKAKQKLFEIARDVHVPEISLGYIVDLLTRQVNVKRTTEEIRNLLAPLSVETSHLPCVWSSQRLPSAFHVDHVIPFSVWGNNDLWNMLPALEAVNLKKSDKMPPEELIRKQRMNFFFYWQHYLSIAPEIFRSQMMRSLGCVAEPGSSEWMDRAINSLVEKSVIFTKRQSLSVWEYSPPN